MFGLVGYDTFNVDANVGRIVINVNIAMTVLSVTAVVLRFISRRLAKQPLLWDDWWILISMPFVWVVVITQFLGKLRSVFTTNVTTIPTMQLSKSEILVATLKTLHQSHLKSSSNYYISLNSYTQPRYPVSNSRFYYSIDGSSVFQAQRYPCTLWELLSWLGGLLQ